MDAKLNHSDLSQLLSKEADMTLVKAEVFTKAFFDLIIEGDEQDGIVKINGLGTFRITEVANRSSVNVNTGEKFEIKGHNKLTFFPADTLKDNVTQPFAMFEPVEVNADLCDEDLVANEEAETETEQPADVVEAVEEQPVAAEEEETVGVEVAVEEPVEETLNKSSADEDGAEEPVSEPAAEQPAEEPVAEISAEQPTEKPVEEHVSSPAVTVRPEPVLVKVPKKDKGMKMDLPKKKKSNRPYYIILLVAMAVAAVYLVTDAMGLFKASEAVVAAQESIKREPAVEEVKLPAAKNEACAVVADTVKSVPVVEPSVEPYRFVMVPELESRDLAAITVADTGLYTIAGEWCRHEVKSNETLTRIALKYYGDKKLWPYLVKHNNLSRPDDLCKGMDISIPMLEPVK